MQSWKEVTEMHAAITRARVALTILAAVAAVSLSLALTTVDPSVMPLPSCPPTC
ncbi:MAG TPA: hypothetical protein VFU99_05240 [Gaiellaceae bacterium]|nr:hypothetical protein [Gaiellaceae bacterium]